MKHQGIFMALFVVLGAAVIAWGSWFVSSGALTGSPQSPATAPSDVAASATGTGAASSAAATGTETAGAGAASASKQTSTQSSLMDNLKIVDVTVGTGTVAQNGDTVTVNYAGKLDDGTTFDSSYSRNQPFSFTLGIGQVIKGWDLGVLGMKVGGTRELTIPADLGYGARGAGSVIPPNATLHFTVSLLSVSQ